MSTITANDLKTKGISAIEELLKEAESVSITVRGEPRYVVIGVDDYRQFRENELLAAWTEVKLDVESGKFRDQTAAEHIAETRKQLAGMGALPAALHASEPAAKYKRGDKRGDKRGAGATRPAGPRRAVAKR